MLDKTIITNFQQLQNKINKLGELTQQNFRQSYMIQTATSMTIEALTNMLIEKGLIAQGDMEEYIKKEQEKKMGKSAEIKDNEMSVQPVFETSSEIPSPGMEG